MEGSMWLDGGELAPRPEPPAIAATAATAATGANVHEPLTFIPDPPAPDKPANSFISDPPAVAFVRRLKALERSQYEQAMLDAWDGLVAALRTLQRYDVLIFAKNDVEYDPSATGEWIKYEDLSNALRAAGVGDADG